MNLIKKLKNGLAGKKTEEGPPEIYYSYYIFGYYEDKPIWDWENWSKCSGILQPIIDLSPEPPLIKTEQSIPVTFGKDNQHASHNQGGVRFGKMVWNEKNNEKWTTKYAQEENWTFFETEIAFPTRSYCHKNSGTDPDLLLMVKNENLTDSKDAKVNQSITIHIGTHLIDEKELPSIEAQIQKVAKCLNVMLAGKLKRPSSYKSEFGIGCTNSYWEGTRGVLSIDDLDFSDDYKRYGISEF